MYKIKSLKVHHKLFEFIDIEQIIGKCITVQNNIGEKTVYEIIGAKKVDEILELTLRLATEFAEDTEIDAKIKLAKETDVVNADIDSIGAEINEGMRKAAQSQGWAVIDKNT